MSLLERLDDLAPTLARHAVEDDRDQGHFPTASFDAMGPTGLLMASVPAEHGGAGLGARPGGDALSLWTLTRRIAAIDLSLARCWEGHGNAMLLLAENATQAQQARWFRGVAEHGQRWAVWSGEPQKRLPGQRAAFGTHVQRVPGGYRITGSKVFATGATGVQWAILLVSTAGPGGARHATGDAEELRMLCCEMSDPTIHTDASWWEPLGMRATVSHKICFEDTFIPDDQEIGRPGAYLLDRWQARFTPHYAASFLGAAEGAYAYALDCVHTRGQAEDPHVQHRVGRMSIDLQTGRLWLAEVARHWAEQRVAEAELEGLRTRWLAEQLATNVVQHAMHLGGARALLRPSPLERIVRDLAFYTRHDNLDSLLSTIGAAELGERHDVSFFREPAPKPTPATS